MTIFKTIIAVIGMTALTSCAANLAQSKAAPSAKLAAQATSIPAQLSVQNPTHILFVGNSYLYYGDSVHNHVRRMAAAAGLHDLSDMKYKSATIGGAAIFDHDMDHLLKPATNRLDAPFQAVIMQGGSAAPLSMARRQKFIETVTENAKKIRSYGGEPVLYMTHAYVRPHKRFRPDMIEDIASLYIEAGNTIKAMVIPVGLAFENAYASRPDMQLHKSFDGSHPNLAGTYLAAATVFASMYGTSPIGNSYDYFGEIDSDTARFLQTIAHDTVSEFNGLELREKN